MLSLINSIVFYILCFCFGKELMVVVKGVDDDIIEMWKWLDEKYGDFVKLVDVSIDSV